MKTSSASRKAMFGACLMLAVLGPAACDDPPVTTDPAPASEEQPNAATTKTPATGAVAVAAGTEKPGRTAGGADAKPVANEKVVVAAAGTRFEPSVPVTQIPDGSWACDMGGQSHYAAGEKGEGKCEVCGMHLKHIGAAAAEAAPTGAPVPRAG